jgi:hypothetical protein
MQNGIKQRSVWCWFVSKAAGGLALTLAVVLQGNAQGAATVYNLALDFSSTDNPSGAWSYGAEPSLAGPFSLFGVRGIVTGDGGAAIQYWQLLAGQEPTIYRNPSSSPITIGGGIITLPPDRVMLYSGTDGVVNGFGAARFTVPADQGGAYTVHSEVGPIYDASIQGDTDFHVLKNGTELFGQFLSGTQTATYSNQIQLLAGDTVEFVVGRGADNSGFAAGLMVFAELSQASGAPVPPEPTSFDLGLDFSPSANPGGVWSYGAEPALAGPFSLFGVNGTVTGDGGAPINYWQFIPGLEPTIYDNPSTQTITIGGGLITLPFDSVMLFSGTDGAANGFGVARFTAPEGRTALYRVQADVSPVYDSPIQGDTDFHVLKKGTQIFGRFLAPTQSASFTDHFVLRPGDVIDFVVGRGTDNSGFASGLKLRVHLQRVGSDPLP